MKAATQDRLLDPDERFQGAAAVSISDDEAALLIEEHSQDASARTQVPRAGAPAGLPSATDGLAARRAIP